MSQKIKEEIFWKHLDDALLDYLGIDKAIFYKKIEPLKAAWDIKNAEEISWDLVLHSKNKTDYIKGKFKEILAQMTNDNN